MKESSTSSLFSPAQQRAMAALGLRLWLPREAASAPSADHPKYYYRLADWLIILPEALPVTGLAWLQDLSRTLVPGKELARPTEMTAAVQAEWQTDRVIDLGQWQGAQLNAEQKRQIWQLICQ